MRKSRIGKKVDKRNNDIRKNLIFLILLIIVFLLGVSIGKMDKIKKEKNSGEKYYAENNEETKNEDITENIISSNSMEISNDDDDYNGRELEEDLDISSKSNTISKDFMKDDDAQNEDNIGTKNSYEEKVDAKDTSNSGSQNAPERYEEEKESSEFDSNKGLYIEWASVKKSSIEQYRIYIKDKNGKYVSGKVEIKTIAGDIFEETVTTDGSENIFIKSVIESVTIK